MEVTFLAGSLIGPPPPSPPPPPLPAPDSRPPLPLPPALPLLLLPLLMHIGDDEYSDLGGEDVLGEDMPLTQ